MKIFIERDGKFENYQTHEKDNELNRLAEQEQFLKRQQANRDAEIKKREDKEKEDLLVQEAEIRLKMKKLRDKEKEIVDTNSSTLKYAFL